MIPYALFRKQTKKHQSKLLHYLSIYIVITSNKIKVKFNNLKN